jgi:peroxiredoxin Q/BCP
MGFTYRLLSDEDRKVGEAYQTTFPPDHQFAAFPKRISYLIDPDGKIVKAYNVTHIPAHPEEMLHDLEAAQGASAPA